MIYPGVQIKAVKGSPLLTDRNHREARTHLRIKAVAVHTEVAWRIPEADEARQYHAKLSCVMTARYQAQVWGCYL